MIVWGVCRSHLTWQNTWNVIFQVLLCQCSCYVAEDQQYQWLDKVREKWRLACGHTEWRFLGVLYLDAWTYIAKYWNRRSLCCCFFFLKDIVAIYYKIRRIKTHLTNVISNVLKIVGHRSLKHLVILPIHRIVTFERETGYWQETEPGHGQGQKTAVLTVLAGDAPSWEAGNGCELDLGGWHPAVACSKFQDITSVFLSIRIN